jgi:hypothetical protein
MAEKLSRRDLLQRTAALGALATLGAAACGKQKAAALSCADTTGLSPQDANVRTLLKYADVSADPAKVCSKCQQFVTPPTPSTCGTCKVLKGPVNPVGSCSSFAPKPA